MPGGHCNRRAATRLSLVNAYGNGASLSSSSWPGIAVRRTACCRTPMSRPSTPSRDAIPSDVDGRH